MELREIARKSCELRGANPDASLGGDGQNFLWMEALEVEVKPTLAALEALGFTVVPKEPTEAMLEAGRQAFYGPCEPTTGHAVYRAMIEASQPEPNNNPAAKP